MWNIKTFKIENLFSYQESTIDFDKIKGQMTCIYGSNQSDPKTLSNGSGKTSLLDCIALGLTGSPLRNISKKDIPRNGCSSGSLELSLFNNVLNKNLLIKIYPHVSKTNKVEIFEDGVLNTQLKDLNPKESHKYVLELLDITESDLLNYYLLGKDTYVSFFTTKDSEKKDVINRFSKANIIDPIDTFIKSDSSVIEKKIIDLESNLTGILSKEELLQSQIETIKSTDLEVERNKVIESMEIKILDLSHSMEALGKDRSSIISKIELEKSNLLAIQSQVIDTSEIDGLKSINDALVLKLDSKRNELSSLDKNYEPKLKDCDDQYREVERQIQELNKTKTETLGLISKIERYIADEIECPSCNHKFCFKDHSYDLEAAKKELVVLKSTVISIDADIASFLEVKAEIGSIKQEFLNEKSRYQSLIQEDIKTLNEEINKHNTKLKEIQKQEQLLALSINKKKIEIDNLSTSLTVLDNKINSIDDQITLLLKDIDNEKIKPFENRLLPIEKQLTELASKKEIINEDILKANLELGQLTSWRNRFKKFKSYLANNSISMIESLANHYLQNMNTNLSVFVDGFREKADGTLKEEISIDISRDSGITKESFYKFSGGEKAKVDVSGILAMQKLINLNSKSGGLDLLWFDEIIDSMDRVALGELIHSLSMLNQTILLISHIELPENNNSIKVEKKFGISNIIMN